MVLLDAFSRPAAEETAGDFLFDLSPIGLCLGMIDPLANRCVRAFLGSGSDTRSNRVQIDVCAGSEQCFVVKYSYRLETLFPECAFNAVILICKTSQRLLERLHEPTEILQTPAILVNRFVVLEHLFDPGRDGVVVIEIEGGRWMDIQPLPDDLFVGPGVGNVGIEASQHVQVVV